MWVPPPGFLVLSVYVFAAFLLREERWNYKGNSDFISHSYCLRWMASLSLKGNINQVKRKTSLQSFLSKDVNLVYLNTFIFHAF